MEDLFAFIARRDLDAATQAAVAHAQFETIHPFADGNGRLGRVIVGRILSQRLDVPVPPPVSVQFARDVGGYQSGLTLFRQGDVESWVVWFADAVQAAATRSSHVLDAVAGLQEGWRAETAGLRADSAARRLLEVIPAHPVLSAQTAADLLEVSEQASRLALEKLARRGVLSAAASAPHGRGRPRRWWVAHDMLALLGR
jgi:Fic family protein